MFALLFVTDQLTLISNKLPKNDWEEDCAKHLLIEDRQVTSAHVKSSVRGLRFTAQFQIWKIIWCHLCACYLEGLACHGG